MENGVRLSAMIRHINDHVKICFIQTGHRKKLNSTDIHKRMF